MDNAVYYTFSTIAQTLAGAIALLAAFGLYRFQILSKALETHAKDLREQYSEEVDLVRTNSYIVKGDFHKFLDYLTKHPIDVTGSDEMDAYIADSLSQLKRLLRFKRSLLRHFYFAIALTVMLITVSIFILMVTPTLALHPDVRSFAFMVALDWVAGCFVSYFFLIRKSLA
jgi:hypothetical protein